MWDERYASTDRVWSATPNVEVARAAAQSLQRCGPVGMEVLRQSPAPVAREALALASLGATSS